MSPGAARDPRPATPVPSPAAFDARFDEFEELAAIGSGGNADVTKQAYHGDGTDVVALKQPRMQGTMDVDSLAQFTAEAETWEKLDGHDHIVGVLDYDSDPLPWIALEYMDGGSLASRLGDLSPAEALWVGVCVARAVRHAHRRGIAHLDLKPDNVLFATSEGDVWDTPKVADWGLAKMLLEHSKSVEGLTPDYAAPEQFDKESFGPADDLTDVYAIGAVVYASLAGEPPFTGASASVMQDILTTTPEPPSDRVGGLPAGTDDVLTKALAKEKDERYESVLDLRRDLETLVDRALGDGDEGDLIAAGASPSVSGRQRSGSGGGGAGSGGGGAGSSGGGAGSDAGGQLSGPAGGSTTAGSTGESTTADRPGTGGGARTVTEPRPGTRDGESGATASGLQAVPGIGPTYAERLRDDGIRSITDLSSTTPSDAASVADVSESRAAQWIDRANDLVDESGVASASDPDESGEYDVPNYHYYMIGMGVLMGLGTAVSGGTGGFMALVGFVGYFYYWNRDMKALQHNPHVDWYPMRIVYFVGSMTMVLPFYYLYKRYVAMKKLSVAQRA